MKINIIKGPLFEERIELAYELLFYIIQKKIIDAQRDEVRDGSNS